MRGLNAVHPHPNERTQSSHTISVKRTISRSDSNLSTGPPNKIYRCRVNDISREGFISNEIDYWFVTVGRGPVSRRLTNGWFSCKAGCNRN